MVKKITLKNGVRIVYEKIPHVRSVSAGIWVGTGSRYETAAESGASHFIEHMVFKGTAQRSAGQLAALMDEIGGQVNAFTTKECTCFYGRVLDTHLRALFDLLGDMLFASRFDDEDVVNERGVIFEEIDMYEDTPEDLVSEQLSKAVYCRSSLARPILGRKTTLSKMDGSFLRGYMREHYRPESIVIAVSGSFTAKDIDYIGSLFSALEPGAQRRFRPVVYTPAVTVRRKPIEQNHLCLAFPGLSLSDEDRYAMQLLSSILGGGMSSRLFQTVRERSGLCYSIYSFGTSYTDGGIFCIYTALSRETEEKTLALILEEIEKIKQDGVTEEELRRTREQVKANVLMGLESTSARMNRLGKGELFLGSILEPEEMIAAYDSVTAADLSALANDRFTAKGLSFSAVGRVRPAEEYRDLLESRP